MADEKSDKGFSVVDRRTGSDEEKSSEKDKSSEGEDPAAGSGKSSDSTAFEGVGQEESGPQEATGPSAAQAEKSESEKGPSDQTGGQVPPANFPSFLLSLHSAALIHLGLVPSPSDNQLQVDLSMARYHIDLLEMLEKKTEGNLDQEEDKLLKNILYELRMAFLEVSKKQ